MRFVQCKTLADFVLTTEMNLHSKYINTNVTLKSNYKFEGKETEKIIDS